MSSNTKFQQDKEYRSRARYQQLKKVKDAHPEAQYMHSPRAFHKLLNLQIASMVISRKKNKVIDLTKTNFAQLVLRNRSSVDFIKTSRRIADQDQYHAYMSDDEVDPAYMEQYNEETDEIEQLDALDEETYQNKLQDVIKNPDKPIEEIVFENDKSNKKD